MRSKPQMRLGGAVAKDDDMSEEQGKYDTETQGGLDMFWQDKPRELPSVLSGFTPAPDILIRRYGYVTALVWGRVWRYCQGKDGICHAKLETIAGELGMSVRTVIRHIEPMVTDGYLKDTTPELRNRPHIYADTFKIRIRISVEATMTESHSAMTESHSHSDRKSHEESIKKEIKKERKATAAPRTPPPPEVQVFREVTKRYPLKELFDDVANSIRKVIARLGRDDVREELLYFYKVWLSKGYNPMNLAWLEWAEAGVVPANGNWKSQKFGESKTAQAVKQFMGMFQPEEVVDVESE